ncbi:MAG: bifunctional tetrahydrofolate synthase/dihydrofolate synthase [Candidatus Parabeggiatoa sp. nov. 1]|nr:MAG: bifunctional tetrahydrofolate synthase/dihydrofolate synthase [Gammaproteobacteria bacterium]
MRFTTLNQWLDWQNSLHPREIELGLTRIRTVAQRLNLLPPPFPIISVAGTNGKGSSVVLLDAILSAAGYRVGRYTSPHLLRYNERICIAGIEASDAQICDAFNLIEEVRDNISLTFFEFATLAAMLVFQDNEVDLAVLEVGLGGRLDAVNLFDAEIALVTAIGIDHVEWLGADRESIGFEKSGIFRAQHPAVCSDANPPQSLIKHAELLQAPLYYLGRDFSDTKTEGHTWIWQVVEKPAAIKKRGYFDLPLPSLPGDFQLQNAAGVLMVLDLLVQAAPRTKDGKSFVVPESAVHQGLMNVNLPGRFQVLPGRVTRILDVAHNPLGAQVLRDLLYQQVCQGETHAVVGMLKDKDIAGVLTVLQESIDHWYVAALNAQRSASVQYLVEQLSAIGVTRINTYPSITTAYKYLLAHTKEEDRIIVFGSFYTVAEVLQVE